MKSKPVHKNAHKYFQAVFDRSKTVIYRCGLAGCPHFVYEPLIIGRVSLCWRCDEEFVITKKSIRNKKLHCEDCTRGRPEQEIPENLDSVIETILRLNE